MEVGFIGLGSMGGGMARNLIKAGHHLVVYNRTKARAEEFRNAGAKAAPSPADAASQADVLITMLADDAALRSMRSFSARVKSCKHFRSVLSTFR